ncbi:MAG: hypothetical protein WBZ36_10580 [Candidatus Nitrosopolaris sp.]
MSIYIPDSEWNNQYYYGQKFEFIRKDGGELLLKPAPNYTRLNGGNA